MFGKGTAAKRGISERTPCPGFEPETWVERHLTSANGLKLCNCRAIRCAHGKNPGTRATEGSAVVAAAVVTCEQAERRVKLKTRSRVNAAAIAASKVERRLSRGRVLAARISEFLD